MMLRGDPRARWLAATVAAMMLAAASPALAAEGADSNQMDAAAGRAPAPDRAASVLAEVAQQLKATQAVVDAAAAEVADREAAKRAADQEAYRAMAHATESLQAGGQGGATPPTEEERSRLWDDVTRSIEASEEAGRRLLQARASLDAARKTAVRQIMQVVDEVQAAKTAAAREVARLSAEAGRHAEEVKQAAGNVAAAEAARAAAEARVQQSKQLALQAIRKTADARRALADAQAAETAIEDELARLAAELERMSEDAGSGL